MGAELIASLKRIATAEPEVVAAYLFGSRALGRSRPDSDLDVAVAYHPRLDAAQREAARRRLVVALADALGAVGERADVLDLARCGSAVAFAAIRDGVLAFARDESARVRLEARIARRYDDDAPHRALFRRAAIAAGRRMGSAVRGR